MTRLPLAATPSADVVSARVGIISLGCPKNLVDTEVLLGRVSETHVVCADPADAEVVIVNTCGFIDQARDESLAVIEEVAGWKKAGKIKGVVVAGCLAQRWGDRIRAEHPDVDAVIGMGEYAQIGEVLQRVLSPKELAEAVQAPWRTLVAEDPSFPVVPQTGRLRVTPPHYAYLMVSDGCDNACTFCSIPTFRGLFRSKPREVVLSEARELIAAGARELNLISQDTTDWGKDIPGSGGLASLMTDVAGLGADWVRILYAYPGHVDDAMIAALRELEQVVDYLDIPIQHISTPVLKRMGRRHTREVTYELLSRLRTEVPGLVLRTTFISGFPGETLEQHREVVEFVKEFRFERLGVFPYSAEPNTPAGEKFEDDIPAEEKRRRVDELMATQQPIAFAHARAQVGATIPVLIEGRDSEGTVFGRSPYDAPEIDPIVILDGPCDGAAVGDLIQAEVVGSETYDLIARIVPAES